MPASVSTRRHRLYEASNRTLIDPRVGREVSFYLQMADRIP